MRLFIAIDLSEECKRYITMCQERVRPLLEKGGTFVPLENFHITLDFLGEIREERIKEIMKIMDGVKWKRFSFMITGEIGSFRGREKKTYYLETDGTKALIELQKDLHKRLEEADFSLDGRKYRPHITLVRNAEKKEEIPPFPSFKENVRSFKLMKSERINSRMVYTPLYERLLDNPV